MSTLPLPRRLVLALLLGCAAVRAALPLRNLRVEMRVADDAARAGGSLSIDSRGGGTATGTLQSLGRTQRAATGDVQQVLVLNGQRARVQVTQLQPLNDVDVAWTPWGAAAAVRTTWVELVNGLEVLPRWSGGDAPVLVELGAQRSAGVLAGGAAAPSQAGVFTTVQVPLGEWVDVAQLQQRSTVTVSPGFGAATSARVQRLQLRVSLA